MGGGGQAQRAEPTERMDSDPGPSAPGLHGVNDCRRQLGAVDDGAVHHVPCAAGRGSGHSMGGERRGGEGKLENVG